MLLDLDVEADPDVAEEAEALAGDAAADQTERVRDVPGFAPDCSGLPCNRDRTLAKNSGAPLLKVGTA